MLVIGAKDRRRTQLSDIIDLLVRYQQQILNVIALSGAMLSALFYWNGKFAERRRRTSADASGGQSTVSISLVAGAGLVAAAAGYWAVSNRPVVSATAGLSAPDIMRATQHNTRLLLLVHGWNGDPAGTWQAFPSLLRSDSSLSAFDVWTIDYPTFLQRRNLGIDQMARWLNETMVRRGYYDQYREIFVIAHSMGGLIAREMLLVNRLSRDNKPYRSLIEIATPHQGANAGALLNILGISTGFSDDLRPGSPMLRALHEKWNALRDRPPTYCLSSPHDNVVTQDSAVFQCDEFLYYPQWGHIDMVKPQRLDDERYQVPVARVKFIRDRLER